MFSHGLFKAVILLAMFVGKQSGPLPTFGEALSRHNIELTQSALIDALENPIQRCDTWQRPNLQKMEQPKRFLRLSKLLGQRRCPGLE